MSQTAWIQFGDLPATAFDQDQSANKKSRIYIRHILIRFIVVKSIIQNACQSKPAQDETDILARQRGSVCHAGARQ
jgi:hypothetical protein